MLIESKIIRPGGSHVSIDKTEYHFAPDKDGKHVCEVADKRHIQRFLSIPEGFKISGADDEPEVEVRTVTAGPFESEPVLEEVDDDEPEDDPDDEPEDDIDELGLEELEVRYLAADVKMDRRKSLRTLRAELRRIELGE